MPIRYRLHPDLSISNQYPVGMLSASNRYVDGISYFENASYYSVNQSFVEMSRGVGMFLQNSCRFLYSVSFGSLFLATINFVMAATFHYPPPVHSVAP